MMTIQDNSFVGGEFLGRELLELTERYKLSLGNFRDLPFIFFADIDQAKTVPFIHSRFKLYRRDIHVFGKNVPAWGWMQGRSEAKFVAGM